MEYNCERRRLFRRALIRELVSLTRVESALDTSGFLERGGGGYRGRNGQRELLRTKERTNQ